MKRFSENYKYEGRSKTEIQMNTVLSILLASLSISQRPKVTGDLVAEHKKEYKLSCTPEKLKIPRRKRFCDNLEKGMNKSKDSKPKTAKTPSNDKITFRD